MTHGRDSQTLHTCAARRTRMAHHLQTGRRVSSVTRAGTAISTTATSCKAGCVAGGPMFCLIRFSLWPPADATRPRPALSVVRLPQSVAGAASHADVHARFRLCSSARFLLCSMTTAARQWHLLLAESPRSLARLSSIALSASCRLRRPRRRRQCGASCACRSQRSRRASRGRARGAPQSRWTACRKLALSWAGLRAWRRRSSSDAAGAHRTAAARSTAGAPVCARLRRNHRAGGLLHVPSRARWLPEPREGAGLHERKLPEQQP